MEIRSRTRRWGRGGGKTAVVGWCPSLLAEVHDGVSGKITEILRTDLQPFPRQPVPAVGQPKAYTVYRMEEDHKDHMHNPSRSTVKVKGVRCCICNDGHYDGVRRQQSSIKQPKHHIMDWVDPRQGSP